MSYAVTPLRLEEHREALARLWGENMSDPTIAAVVGARIRWLYEGLPDGRPTTLLCLEQESGAVVGCGSFIARAVQVARRPVQGGVLCDFAVARAHRVGGAALMIQRGLVEAARAAGVELLYGYPNEKSVGIFKRIGYRVVGETSTWVKPLRAVYTLGKWLPAGVAEAAATPADLVLALLDRTRRLRAPARARAAPLAGPDARHDDLWARARSRYDVTGERSSAFLTWRYGRFVTAEYRFFGAFSPEQDRLTAYAVYTTNGGRALVYDLVVDEREVEEATFLLMLAAHLRAEGAQFMVVHHVGAPAFAERLRGAGFVRRPGARPLVLHPGLLGERIRDRALDAANWFMLDGELDI